MFNEIIKLTDKRLSDKRVISNRKILII